MRRGRVAAAGAAAVAAVAAAAMVAGGGDSSGATRASTAPGATATLERRDLVDRETVDGTLGYADGSPFRAGPAGTLTAIRESGSVVRRGQSLYDVEDEPAAWLLNGSLPAWRDFTPYMSDGDDVLQLERNLRALGYDPYGEMTLDDEWTWATTEAVERFQDARGLSEDGALAQGEVVFRPGPSRVGELQAAVGQELAPGAELGELSTTRREVTVDLDADRQELVRTGDTVTVELPNGDTARGRITEVGKVATEPASEDAEPTIEVTIALRGRAARGSGLDQAPVDVGFASERREHVLAVPVTALLARSGGGFAVETAEGRLVPVDPGVYADDYVEVSGAGLREGMRDEVGTACGTESAKVGPFYCPADHGVYLDTRFFDALARTAGVELGDFAQAYVVAHEVAHHVQTLVGTLQRVRGLDETDPAGANARSVRLELQADCFAGIWKHSRYLRGQLTPSQLADALRAAAVVGSDFQQLSATGTIRPEDWTHGTSRQRQHWVTVGFEKGRPAARDTFRGG